MRALESLRPGASHLGTPGHRLLMTRCGPLDILGMIGRGWSYIDLLPASHEIDLGGGLRVRVLNLETLFAGKKEVGGEKDKAGLPLLRRTLEDKRWRNA